MLKYILPLGLLAYALSKKGEGVKKLEYEVVGVQVYRVTLPLDLDLRVAVRFNNPSSQRYTVNSIRLNVKQGGTLVGDIFANQSFVIEAGSRDTVKFPVSLRGLALAGKLVPLLAQKKPLPELEVSGFLTVEGVETALDGYKLPLAPYDPRATTTPTKEKAAEPKPKAPAKPAPKAPAKAPAKKPAAKPVAKKPAAKPVAKKPAPAAPKKPTAAPAKKAVPQKKLSTQAPRN